MIELKKQLRYNDIVVWVSFGLMLLVKLFTIFLFVQITEETKASIEAVATVYEANPLAKIAINLKQIGMVLIVLVLPGSAMAGYYYMRRKAVKGKIDVDHLTFFVQFAFFTLLINIVNDGAALLSKMVQVIG